MLPVMLLRWLCRRQREPTLNSVILAVSHFSYCGCQVLPRLVFQDMETCFQNCCSLHCVICELTALFFYSTSLGEYGQPYRLVVLGQRHLIVEV